MVSESIVNEFESKKEPLVLKYIPIGFTRVEVLKSTFTTSTNASKF